MDCKHNATLLPDIDQLREGMCPVDWARQCVETAYQNNCGKSVMCRDGMAQLRLIVEDIVSGRGQNEDIPLLRELCQVIATTGGCTISRKAAANVLYTLDNFSDEWDSHCRRKRCSALVCPAYFGVYIDPARCTGCGLCLGHAPEGAVLGDETMIHVIAREDEVKTADFLACCPQNAVQKYGAVKPRHLPEAPIPVGSAGESAAPRRRRRRD